MFEMPLDTTVNKREEKNLTVTNSGNENKDAPCCHVLRRREENCQHI
jgi:hypothetical protein